MICPLGSGRWRDGRSTVERNVVLGGTGTVRGSNIDRRASGRTYFHGRPDVRALRTRLPVGAFAPVHADRVPRASYAVGLSVLGAATRPAGAAAQWAAGAVPAPSASGR